jgi:hypothetical protein
MEQNRVAGYYMLGNQMAWQNSQAAWQALGNWLQEKKAFKTLQAYAEDRYGIPKEVAQHMGYEGLQGHIKGIEDKKAEAQAEQDRELRIQQTVLQNQQLQAIINAAGLRDEITNWNFGAQKEDRAALQGFAQDYSQGPNVPEAGTVTTDDASYAPGSANALMAIANGRGTVAAAPTPEQRAAFALQNNPRALDAIDKLQRLGQAMDEFKKLGYSDAPGSITAIPGEHKYWAFHNAPGTATPLPRSDADQEDVMDKKSGERIGMKIGGRFYSEAELFPMSKDDLEPFTGPGVQPGWFYNKKTKKMVYMGVQNMAQTITALNEEGGGAVKPDGVWVPGKGVQYTTKPK